MLTQAYMDESFPVLLPFCVTYTVARHLSWLHCIGFSYLLVSVSARDHLEEAFRSERRDPVFSLRSL